MTTDPDDLRAILRELVDLEAMSLSGCMPDNHEKAWNKRWHAAMRRAQDAVFEDRDPEGES